MMREPHSQPHAACNRLCIWSAANVFGAYWVPLEMPSRGNLGKNRAEASHVSEVQHLQWKLEAGGAPLKALSVLPKRPMTILLL